MPRDVAAVCGAWFDKICVVASMSAVAVAPAVGLLCPGHRAILRAARCLSGDVVTHQALRRSLQWCMLPLRWCCTEGICYEFFRHPFLGTPRQWPPEIHQCE